MILWLISFKTIPEVPNGLVAVAGILNKIEKGLSDIISTSGGYPPGAQYDKCRRRNRNINHFGIYGA